MNADFSEFAARLWTLLQQHREAVAAAAVILVLAIAIRVWLRWRPARLPRIAAAPAPGPARHDMQAIDVSTAAAAEVAADISAYARGLFAEDMAALAARAAGGEARPLRFSQFGEASFVYDGVIMRDVTLLPNILIAPVGAHFRQAQAVLDAMRRLGSMTPADPAEERVAALRGAAETLAAGIDRATVAAEKLDLWLGRNGVAVEGPRGLADLPVPALRNASVDRYGQRVKTYRILREQALARLEEIDGFIEQARRQAAPPVPHVVASSSSPPASSFDPAVITVKPSDKTAAL